MLDYLQAGEIRRKYPKNLSRQDIDSIIEQWDAENVERKDMLHFSSMFDPKSHRLNISELELTLRAEMHFNLKYLQDNEFYGMLAATNFENLTHYNSPYETEKETYELRFIIGKEFLDECKKLNHTKLSDAFKTLRKIRDKTRIKYKSKKHYWEKELDELVDEYILE